MKFKAGDKVKILNRVGSENNYYPSYVDDMLKYAGTLASIDRITTAGSLVLDNNDYYWDKKAVMLVNEGKYLHPAKLKDGDFIKIQCGNYKFIYIFREYKDNNIYRYVSLDLEDNSFDTDPSKKWGDFSILDKITYATEEEKHLLNEALLKEGYIWDNLTKKLHNLQVTTCSISSETTIDTTVTDNGKEKLNLLPTKKHYQLNFNY